MNAACDLTCVGYHRRHQSYSFLTRDRECPGAATRKFFRLTTTTRT